MSERVSIVGLDKVALLHYIWMGAPSLYDSRSSGSELCSRYPPPEGSEAFELGDHDRALAKRAIEKGLIAVWRNRVIECDLSGDSVDARAYDLMMGPGELAGVVEDFVARVP